MKKCRQCRKEKDESEFHIRQVVCRKCQNAERRAKRKEEGPYDPKYREADYGHVDDCYSLDILKL